MLARTPLGPLRELAILCTGPEACVFEDGWPEPLAPPIGHLPVAADLVVSWVIRYADDISPFDAGATIHCPVEDDTRAPESRSPVEDVTISLVFANPNF
jgi:hypothetical protein